MKPRLKIDIMRNDRFYKTFICAKPTVFKAGVGVVIDWEVVKYRLRQAFPSLIGKSNVEYFCEDTSFKL